jgi:uncharacterized protein Yka (UPF0111/DUF47 family)
MFHLLPRDTVFYDLFEGLSGHAVKAASTVQQLARSFPDVTPFIQRIREEEHQADELAHQCLDRLDRTFITPFDREDIHTLVGELDDIIDGVDALAKRFPLFHVKRMEDIFIKQTGVLLKATEMVDEAVKRLRHSRKLPDLSDALIAIHTQESIGDDNHHAAMSGLFNGSVDALEVLKWKELYDMMEDAIDDCEDVGNTLERIVLKNG